MPDFLTGIGSAIKKGIRKLGELQPDGLDDGAPMPQPMPRRPMPVTGGFAGNEGVPKFDISSMGKPGRYRGDAGSEFEIQNMGDNAPQPMPQRPPMPAVNVAPPVEMRPNHPPLTGFDQGAGRMMDQEIAPIRDSVTIRPDAEPRPAPMRGGMPSAIPMPEMMQEANPNDDRRNVPIPGLPNRGGPVPYSPYEAARYDSVMKGAKRDADGNLLTKEQGGGFKRDWKTGLQNALLGAANAYAANPQGGLGALAGGALGGGLGATFNPQAGREMVFDAGQGAQMLQDEQRQAQRNAQQAAQEKARQEALRRKADIDNINSQIEERRKPKRTTVSPGTAVLEGNKEIYKNPALPRPTTPAWKQTRTGEWFDANDPANKEKLTQGAVPGQSQLTIRDYEDQRANEEGTVEKITLDSYNGRGGDSYVVSKLPPQLQQALKNPTQLDLSQLPKKYQKILDSAEAAEVAEKANPGITVKAEMARNQLMQQHQQLVMQAQNEFQQMKQQELSGIRRYTEEEARRNAGRLRQGGASRPSGGGSSAPRATVAPDFVDRVMREATDPATGKKGITREQAIQRLQNSGIQVQ